jgi:chromosome segregation ATPase
MRAQIGRVLQVLGIGSILAVTASMSMGASPQAPAANDPLPALLAEVHALRVAMEQQATVGPRMQLTLARLTIEEQRVSHLSSDLTNVRQQLAGQEAAAQRTSAEAADLERQMQMETDPAKRREMEAGLRNTQLQMRQFATEQQQLQIRENEAAQALAAEQARWADLNSRLDELERLLAPVR